MLRFLAFIALSASWGCIGIRAQSITTEENTTDDICSDRYWIKPQDTDTETYLGQYKPCGWYVENCSHKFDSWFDRHGGFDKDDPHSYIKANTDYPGYGDDGNLEVSWFGRNKVYLVEFDIGLDKTAYDAAKGMKNEPGAGILIDDIDQGELNYVSFPKNEAGEYSERKTMEFGETCIETFARVQDRWKPPNDWRGIKFNNYGCMGFCGRSCFPTKGNGKDCMKHDVCSHFKTVALNESADGFCRDFDCGDEAAQTVINCKNRALPTPFAQHEVCTEDSVADISKVVRVHFEQKKECILRSKWDRNQGMPWVRRENGARCDTTDDCQSRRCEYRLFGIKKCKPRLGAGKGCNEHTDCISLQCKRRGWRWRCK